jgi:hypothetical protein
MYRFFTILAILAIFATPTFAATVILVGSGAPDPVDTPIIERLEQMGFTVESHSHDEEHPVDLSGADLVFISASTESGNIAGAYKDSDVPVINCEAYTYDDMGYAPDDTGFSGDAEQSLTIVDPDHPIAQGVPEQVQVLDPEAPIHSASNLGGDVHPVAVKTDDDTQVAIAVFDEGASLVTGQTNARHVTMFPVQSAWLSLTDDGWTLMENAILFAYGPTAVKPAGKLAVKWADIKTR